jgi:hypothetical protein
LVLFLGLEGNTEEENNGYVVFNEISTNQLGDEEGGFTLLTPMYPFLRKFFGQIFKGTVSQDFLLQIFSWIIFPQAPKNKILVISNFFQHLALIFGSQDAPPVSTTLAANLPLVSTTPVANLPLVSMTAAVNFVTGTAGVIDTGSNRCQWTAYTFKWFWRKKFICYVNTTTHRCPNKTIQTFLANAVNDTGCAPRASNISVNFQKNSKRP